MKPKKERQKILSKAKEIDPSLKIPSEQYMTKIYRNRDLAQFLKQWDTELEKCRLKLKEIIFG